MRKHPDFLVGIDIGSTTIKAVALERCRPQEILWQDYQRHETRQGEKLLEFLRHLESLGIRSQCTAMFFTGSGGNALAPVVGAKFVQEVHAVSLAVEAVYPDVRSVIELGGQDAKIILFVPDSKGNSHRRICSMNDRCAGGTGAVIEKIAAKLELSREALARHPYQGLKRHPVAAKCGVFAETDINSLQKRGVPGAELMASLFDAIVAQNLSLLARGHTLHPKVLLLGGPNTFIRGMRQAWRAQIQKMWEDRGIGRPGDEDSRDLILAPTNGHYFGALGAVEFGREAANDLGRYQGSQHLEEYLTSGQHQQRSRSAARGLVESAREKEDFTARFAPPVFRPASLRDGERVKAFIGIDAGSTSTKAVLLSPAGEVLRKAYRLSRENPISETIQILEDLRTQVEKQGAHLQVLGVATTGYAKDIVQKVIEADTALVETAAHARSALARYSDVDVVVDVGGQDIKLIRLEDGRVKDFLLNSQCSAGTGYFLQSTAEALGYSVEDYAEIAFRARSLPKFSYGCAVFLQSDIVNFQRQGWRPEEILAGLTAVLPKNIWLYVAKVPNPARLGRHFVLQGGTQNNLAAVKAHVDFIRERCAAGDRPPRISVHEHCGEAGAVGAALEARRLWREGRQTSFIGLDALRQISYRTTSSDETRCPYCKNRCERTFIDFETERRAYPTNGNSRSQIPGDGRNRLILASCEKGSAESVEEVREIRQNQRTVEQDHPNLVDLAAREVWKRPRGVCSVADPFPRHGWLPSVRRRVSLMQKRAKVRVGIPRVLDLYQFAPFFSGYFRSLGVPGSNLVYSDFTNRTMFAEGAQRGAIDPCFPSKIANAHIHNLISVKHPQRPLDFIFFPMLDELETHLVNMVGRNACPTVALTPEAVKASFTKEQDLFAEQNIRYLSPLLNLPNRKLLTEQMFEVWEPILGLSRAENERAIESGFAWLEDWESRLSQQARRVLDRLEQEKRLGIVLLGRPYHHDPGLNHGIPAELQRLGYPILSQSTLPLDRDLLERLFGEEVRQAVISHPLDVSDVWKHNYSVGNSQKLWAAKFTARHPNLVGVEFSSFKCGHDAPTYSVVEEILRCSGTPFFSFRDMDENKPAGSIQLRIETIDYYLTRYRERLFGTTASQAASGCSAKSSAMGSVSQNGTHAISSEALIRFQD